jgi:RpiR family transcriptional regulator, carbohydrate utilization regulator
MINILDSAHSSESDATSGAGDVLRSIRDAVPSLSASHRRIAAVILEDPSRAVQNNIEDLAKRAKVSAPTVVRFARAVDCDGLRDLKLKLAGALALGTPYLHRGVGAADTTGDVIRNVVGSITSVLAEWQRQIGPGEIERVADAFNRAGRIDCYGTGQTSHFLAQDMQARFFRLGLIANAYSDAHLQLVAAATLTEKDVLFAISFVGRMPTLIEAVRLGKERGAMVVALTRSHTPLARLSDIVLPVDVPSDATMRVGTDAYVVQLAMIEILMVSTGLKRGPEAMQRLAIIHHALQKHGIDSDEPSVLHWGWSEMLNTIVERHGDKDPWE